MTKPHILIVEDNETYLRAAEQYFHLNFWKKVNITTANDYVTAKHALQNDRTLTGVITDCFFPYGTGSNETALGEVVIEKIIAGVYGVENTRAAANNELWCPLDEQSTILAECAQYVDVPEDMRQRLENYAAHCAWENIQSRRAGHDNIDRHKKLLRSISAGDTLADNRIRNTESMRNELKLIPCDLPPFADLFELKKPRSWARWTESDTPEETRTMYVLMCDYLQKSEHNQALGVLVAEEATAKRIPTVLFSSAYHHDDCVQSIVDYHDKQYRLTSKCKYDWRLSFDNTELCNMPPKDNLTSWSGAYRELEDLRQSWQNIAAAN